MNRPPLVVDTDPGIDDALALIYLVALGKWDLKAVTAVAGNVELDQTFDNAARLLALLGSEAPLHAGCPKPLLRELQTATNIHGPGGLGSVTLPGGSVPARNEHAVAAIDRLAREHEGELTVLTLGPLTNLAAALILNPDTSRRIRRVVSMAGAARVPGNVTSTAEFNAYADPEALKIVVDSGVSWCMVGLDVTHETVFTSDDLASLEGDRPAVTCARDLLRSYLELSGGGPCALHDPLAAAVASDPSWVVTERGRIRVRTDDAGRGGHRVHRRASERAGFIGMRGGHRHGAAKLHRSLRPRRNPRLFGRRGRGQLTAAEAQVVVVGSINVDFVVTVQRLPRAAETVTGDTFERHHGGKGANQAVAASRAGAAVRFLGAVGADDLGEEAVAALVRQGIDTDDMARLAESATGVALIMVDAQAENLIAVASGANSRLSGPTVTDVLGRRPLSGRGVFLSNLEVPDEAILAGARAAAAAGWQIIIDPAPARRLPQELLDVHPVLTPNAGEAGHLSGTADPEAAARALAARTSAPVIVTLGADGALVVDDTGAARFDAFHVDAVDTTGAGDTFNGVMAASLSRGLGLTEAVRRALAGAALSITVRGAREGMPDEKRIESFLRGSGW